MSSFAFLILCIQASLIQNAFTQCIGPGIYGDAYGYGSGIYGDGYGYGPGIGPAAALAPGLGGFGGPLEPLAAGPIGAYGGAGVGEVAVAGELPVAGTTLVAGQVPILGAVEFGGIVPAAGAVTISGACACGCAGPYGPGFIY